MKSISPEEARANIVRAYTKQPEEAVTVLSSGLA
jgi:hypothetical protein